MRCSRLAWLLVVLIGTAPVAGADVGNRLAYLNGFCNPYYVGRETARLVTPQWVGEPGVEAVVVLSIDDLGDPAQYEAFLRPILQRLKRIDGRAPVSLMTTQIDPDHPQLAAWLREGLSIEAHTHDHPCPCLQGGDFGRAKATYDRCIDRLFRIPNTEPVAFRMPCCDSMNSVSPRFFAEIFHGTTPEGHFVRADSSVFMLFTPADPTLPRELVFEENGRQRFAKYVPRDRDFVNYVEDYPYPYVIDRLCFEVPSAIPDDWQGYNLYGPHSPTTVGDMKAAIDATVIKQGVFVLTFHPGTWIRSDQVLELVEHAITGRQRKVRLLTLRDVHERLTRHLLGGCPLRGADGRDNGVRLLDLNRDGYMDVVIGNQSTRQTRIWSAETGEWTTTDFPVDIVDGNGRDAGVRFGVLREDGSASVLVRNQNVAGLWHFEAGRWVRAPGGVEGLEVDGPVFTSLAGRDRGVRLRDLEGDGICELLVGNPEQQGVFRWLAGRGLWERLPFSLPPKTAIVDGRGRDAGLRFVDVDVDGHPDVIFSDPYRYSVSCFTSMTAGWSRTLLSGSRDEAEGSTAGDTDPSPIPAIVRADGTNNGAWFSHNHMWVQNEQTGGKLPHQVETRHFTDLLGTDREPPPRSPEESLRSFDVLPGFQIELVAAEPMVFDPVDIGWGPDGKTWVVEYADYPMGLDDRGEPGGRIRCLEDTDGDGRYDRSTVFLEPIAYPMGILPWRQGVLVTAAPEIFYAEDTDGDGRADLRETLFAGFGEGNRQHRVNHPRWGLDNWVHAANGDSGGTITSLKTGRKVSISGRDLRFRPDAGLIDAQSGQTQFGTNRDDWGNWFGCNNSNPGWLYALADHYLRRNPHVAPPPGRADVTPDRAVYPVGRVISHCDLKHRPHAAWAKPGTWTSVAGVTIYRDDLFGPHFTGNLFCNDSVYCVVHRRILQPDGVTFRGERGPDEQEREFLASHDVWFRPSTQETGPDGALWVLDMYRFVIEHPEWIDDELEKTLDLRAGHDRGRIYRIYPVGKRPRPIPRLDQLDTAGLVAALDSPNGWQRDMAHQMLLWRADESAVGPLEAMVVDCPRVLARLHALCVLDGLGRLRAEIAIRALCDEHPGMRRHAIRVSEPLLGSHPAVGEALLKLESEADPFVEMQLAYSLGEWRDPRAGRLLGRLATRYADDRYRLAAVMSSAAAHLEPMVAELMLEPDRPPTHTRLTSDLLRLAVSLRDHTAIARVLRSVAARTASGYRRWQYEAMAQLVDALDRQKTTLGELLADVKLRTTSERVSALFDAARVAAVDHRAATADRLAALAILGRGPDRREEDLRRLAALLEPQTPIELQLAVVESMTHLRRAEVPGLLLAGWSEQGPKLNAAIVDALLSRPEWTRRLLDALADEPELATILGTTRRDMLLHHADEAIRHRAEQLLGGVTTSEDIEKKLEQYAPVLDLPGDPIRGKRLFVDTTCGDCHRLEDVGTDIATDLRTLVDKSPGALLLATIDPNRAVEDKYIEYTAVTSDGLILSGMLLEETSTSITLADTAGKLHRILRKDLEELVSMGRSHMPEGLEAKMDHQQMADLFAFIGRCGPARRELPGNRPELITAEPDGSLALSAARCEVYAPGIKMSGTQFLVWFYRGPNDHVAWSVDVPAPGAYEVWIEWAQIDEYADNPIAVEVEGTSAMLATRLPSTGGWGNVRKEPFGVLGLEAGRQRIRLRPNGPNKTEVADLRGLHLVPVKQGK